MGKRKINKGRKLVKHPNPLAQSLNIPTDLPRSLKGEWA